MLNKNILENKNIEYKATREGFGDALLKLGETNPNVVAVCADLTDSVMMGKFKEKYPKRFVEVGIQEQNMSGVASGLSHEGLIPFMASYAAFSPGRNLEQIRTTIAYNDNKVVIVGAHAGLSVGPDGGTHQALEDIALMRTIPNITVYSPCDYYEAYELTMRAVEVDGPVYIRLAREKTPILFDKDLKLSKNKTDIIYKSNFDSHYKLAILATGPILFNAIKSISELESSKISLSIFSVHTIKNLDYASIVNIATQYKNIITLEEHQVSGGLGGLVSEILSTHYPARVLRIGVNDKFGQSGNSEELYKHYELDSDAIIQKAKDMVFSNI